MNEDTLHIENSKYSVLNKKKNIDHTKSSTNKF